MTEPRRSWLFFAASLVALALAVGAMLPFRSSLDTGTVALILLLPPLLAAGAGRRTSLAMALASALAFDVIYTHPYWSPRITSSTAVTAFVVYVVVALAVGQMVTGVLHARAEALRHAHDAELMQRLATELIQSGAADATARSAFAELVAEASVRGAALQAVVGGKMLAVSAGESAAALAVLDAAAAATASGPVSLRGTDGVLVVPVRASERVFGFLAVEPLPGAVERELRALLESFAGILGLAMLRDELREEAIASRTLEEADRLRTSLLQSVSHDLRTPLTAIKAIASTLRSGAPESERQGMLLDIERQADRLHRLVASMLDLSRIESGVLRPRLVLTPVDDLVNGAVEAAASALRGRNVAVDVPDQLTVEADETMIHQVLVNLLENAAEASRHAADGTLALRARPVGDVVRFEVADHGIGIPEPERRRVFEPYQRLRPDARREGAGLGLAIARGFAEAHAGTLSIAPTPGGGATFRLDLPQRRGVSG